MWRKICVSKSARLILGGKYSSQNPLGQLIVEREFMLVICNNFLLKLAFASTCLCGPRKSKLRLKSELCKQQYTVTLFDFNHWAHVIVLWQMQKICVTVQFLLCFIFNLRAISEYKPPGVCIWRCDLSEGFLRYEFGEGMGGLYLEGLIFRILRQMAGINLPTNAALTMLNYC